VGGGGVGWAGGDAQAVLRVMGRGRRVGGVGCHGGRTRRRERDW